MPSVFTIADRIAMLHEQLIAFVGTPEEAKAHSSWLAVSSLVVKARWVRITPVTTILMYRHATDIATVDPWGQPTQQYGY